MQHHSEHPDVQAAEERLREEKVSVQQLEKQLEALRAEAEEEPNIARLKAKARVGGGDPGAAEAAIQARTELEARIDKTADEIATGKQAIRLLEGRLQRATQDAKKEVFETLAEQYKGQLQTLTTHLQGAQEALEAAAGTYQLMRKNDETSDFPVPRPHLPPPSRLVIQAGRKKKELDAFTVLREAAGNGIRPK